MNEFVGYMSRRQAALGDRNALSDHSELNGRAIHRRRVQLVP